ncbi:MAG: M28 family peptidase [Acidobacteriota bacterium]
MNSAAAADGAHHDPRESRLSEILLVPPPPPETPVPVPRVAARNPDSEPSADENLTASAEIFAVDRDGATRRLTDNGAWDGEPASCPIHDAVIYTSVRDGDFELYLDRGDGSEAVRLTESPGYDGGASFSSDCSLVVWHASRPRGRVLDTYRLALDEGRIADARNAGRREIWIAEVTGEAPRRLTYLRHRAQSPVFLPGDGELIFSSDHTGDRELWTVATNGSGLRQITFTAGEDDEPMPSPDGSILAWRSERSGGGGALHAARWIRSEAGPQEVDGATAADRIAEAIRWLADDERGGRGLGTEGLAAAEAWLGESFQALGLEPAGDAGYFHSFEVPVAVRPGAGTSLTLGGQPVADDQRTPAAFSSPGAVEGDVVPAGYGIVAPDLSHDDYDGLDVEGKIVVVRRFVPQGARFDDPEAERRYGGLRYKAFIARERGAAGLLVVDLPEVAAGEAAPEEAVFPDLRLDAQGDAGLPVMVVSRSAGAILFEGGHRASMVVELTVEKVEGRNVVARLPGSDPSARPTLVGAHFDHLGLGPHGSLEPDSNLPHNGADDNASGTAALVEIGRGLMARRDELRGDVYLAAFSAEERGLWGSTALVRKPPSALRPAELGAMINLDMIGRLRRDRVSVLGAGSAEEWGELVPPVCRRMGLSCILGGDGYGPSDQTPFYAAGVPVLHFFTGTHGDYHRPSDDADKINAIGTARIAATVEDLVVELSSLSSPLTYVQSEAPQSGDARSFGASLGTIPDYTGDDRPGVLLSGARPGSAADRAGMLKGDLLVEIDGREVRNIYDFVYVLRSAKPGQTVSAAVIRDGERIEVEITYDQGRRRP